MLECASSQFAVMLSSVLSLFEKPMSDQLKRDLLIEGSAASNSNQLRRDCLGAGMEHSFVVGVSRLDNAVAKDSAKSKEKALSPAGDEGGVMGVFVKKQLQFWHVMPYPSMEHSRQGMIALVSGDLEVADLKTKGIFDDIFDRRMGNM